MVRARTGIAALSFITCSLAAGQVAANPHADAIYQYSPGSFLFGAVAPTTAQLQGILGAPNGVSLGIGIGGQITLKFVDNMIVDGAGADLQVNSFFPGSGSNELDNRANIFVSADGIAFSQIGSFVGGGTSYSFDLASVGYASASYVRIVDVGRCCFSGNSQGGGDGFNVESATVIHSVAAIPEPETYAMLLAGLGLLGWHARRRKLKQSSRLTAGSKPASAA